MGLVKLMSQLVVIGNCETVENCAFDRKLLSVHCGADCTFSARFLSWCPRPAISFKGHQYLYFALSMELIFNFQDKTSQKLRNCPNSRYSKYSRYSSIVKFGRNCENLVNFYQFGLEGSEFITMMYGQTQNFSLIAIWGCLKCLKKSLFGGVL